MRENFIFNFCVEGNSPFSSTGGLMGTGVKTNDYKRWLRVRCFDSIGSWTDVYIEAQSFLPSAEVVAAQAACMY